MTLKEFIESAPEQFKWHATALKHMKPAMKFATAEFSIIKTKEPRLKRGECDRCTIGSLQFVTGGGKALVNGVGPMSWGEAKRQIAAILRCDKTEAEMPIAETKTEVCETAARPCTSWTNYALLDLINEELGKGNHKTIDTKALAEQLLAEKK